MAYKSGLDPDEAFTRLVEKGCPKELLQGILKRLYDAGKNPSTCGDSVKHKALAVDAAVHRVAERLKSLVRQPGAVTTLPELRFLATALVLWSRGIDRLKSFGGHEPAFNHARASLIQTVYRYTRAWRDEEVSVLVSDALGQVVDRLTQQRWRQRHGELIEWAKRVRTEEALEGLRGLLRR